MRNHGFTLLEILITMLIVSIGLLGLASLMTRIHLSELEAYQRTQALILLSDITERLNSVNVLTRPCFGFTTNLTDGTPYIGTTGSGWALPAPCATGTTAHNTQVDTIITTLNNQLQGLSETKAGSTTGSGAMLGARVCIRFDSTDLLLDSLGNTISGTELYTITVAWQGVVPTFAPTSACANGLYGAETLRRTLSTTIRFASLTAARLETEILPWL
ncbi:MAG: prepilin-type N-terminal cleavage/methylation domain-containing protein [Magnetococcales bacterium]|nr:prepilin-type N-terminal cleavage/methylation domain-containing protein [Magnetococcales bacterium]